jgi:hypothetical protein
MSQLVRHYVYKRKHALQGADKDGRQKVEELLVRRRCARDAEV